MNLPVLDRYSAKFGGLELSIPRLHKPASFSQWIHFGGCLSLYAESKNKIINQLKNHIVITKPV